MELLGQRIGQVMVPACQGTVMPPLDFELGVLICTRALV
jgi:hypothetical protein